MKHHIVITLASLPLFLAGCTTAKIADYQPASAATTERAVQQSGVEVALDPFVEKARTEKYFDMDAVAEGIAILHVRVANKTADQTFLVLKKNVRLIPIGAGTAMTGDGKQIERSKTGAETTGIIGGVAGSAPLILVSAAMLSKSTETQRNFVGKEMPDQTLSPGESMEGFVYFTPVKKGEDWSRATTAQVDLVDTKSHQTTELTIPFSN